MRDERDSDRARVLLDLFCRPVLSISALPVTVGAVDRFR
jgi:hypothetical protein